MGKNERIFNLVDASWIGVRYCDGDEREISLKSVFEDANDIQCLANDIATQDFALLRMLLAILQRSLAECVDDDESPSEVWKQLWERDELPLSDIKEYLAKFYDRFWLFDDEKPFMQVANLQSTNGKNSELKKLVVDIPDGLELFSQRSGSTFSALEFSEAARWLVHAHAFDVSGIKTGVVGDPAVKSGKSYPIGPGWAGQLGGVYLEGSNLRETLLLNLVLWQSESERSELSDIWDDVPVWEQDQKGPGDDARQPLGRADLYTWQSRRVRLMHCDGKVVGMILSNGDRLNPPYNRWDVEPMTRWRRSIPQEKKLRIVPVYFPAQHQSNRALWRGLSSVLPMVGEEEYERTQPPGVVLWANYLTSANGGFALDQSFPLRVRAAGYEYGVQNAVVTECIDDVLDMHAFLISAQGAPAASLVVDCIENTNTAVGHFGYLVRTLRLSRGDSLDRAKVVQRDAEAQAFFELDKRFRGWLSRIDQNTNLLAALNNWNREASYILQSLARTTVAETGPNSIVGRKVESNRKESWESAGNAEARFFAQLRKTLPYTDEQSSREKGD